MELLDPRVGERKRDRQRWLWPFDGPVCPRESGPMILLLKLPAPNVPVNFLKILSAAVRELASSVGRELRAHSGLRRMET